VLVGVSMAWLCTSLPGEAGAGVWHGRKDLPQPVLHPAGKLQSPEFGVGSEDAALWKMWRATAKAKISISILVKSERCSKKVCSFLAL